LYAHLYVHITIPTYFVTVIHLLCYFMLCAFVTYSIKLLLLIKQTNWKLLFIVTVYTSTSDGT